MNPADLREKLALLPISDARWFDQIGSTNDEALAWVTHGAYDGCLVAADSQTQGRGRLGRRWVTQPGAALAFSLILKPTEAEMGMLELFSPLGAVAICQALQGLYGLKPEIKWPNDVLLNRRKVAGILVEAAWLGDRLQGIVTGIGVNVAPQAVPPDNEVLFPATSVEDALGQPVNRFDLLRGILEAIFHLRGQLRGGMFFETWRNLLAFKNEWVSLSESGPNGSAPLTGQLQGIDPAGNLLLQLPTGEVRAVTVGDVSLRLANP